MATTTTPVTAPLRAEHRQLAPHLDELRAVAASVGAWSGTVPRLLEALVDTAAEVGPGPARAEEVEDLKGQLYSLWAILQLHFAKEEEVLLPVLDAALDPADVRRLFEAMSARTPSHREEPAT